MDGLCPNYKGNGLRRKAPRAHPMATTMIDDPNVTRLTAPDREVILVGTAHVSHESVALVERVIADERPDAVAVELCEPRRQALMGNREWQTMDIVKVIRQKKAYVLLAHLLMASFQKRIARQLDIEPGAEMRQAIASAELVDAEVELVDRPIAITLARAWRGMSFWMKMKLFAELLVNPEATDELDEAAIEEIKRADILSALLDDLGKAMPVVRTTLIDERDEYMADKLRKASGRKIVAVVGAGHVAGITRRWADADTDMAALSTTPRRNPLWRGLAWALPALVVGLIIAGFAFAGKEAGQDMLVAWVAVNGIMAGIGALLAAGHPLTILAAVGAAPLTSLNPMIAAGWVSGLTEATLRKPMVMDFETISDDILSLKRIRANRITRILLVVILTNLGSGIGTFAAMGVIAKVLA